MPEAILDSFQALTKTEFKSHANAVLGGHLSSDKRKAGIAYLQQVQSADGSEIETERAALWAKRREHVKKQKELDSLIEAQAFDFSRQACRRP